MPGQRKKERKRVAPKLFQPKDRDKFLLELYPWVKGFVQKEYGRFLNPSDLSDLRHEGMIGLMIITDRLMKGEPRFLEKEFMFYVKAVVRNAIRDYSLTNSARFGISLFKLRRHLKDSDQELGEFMGDIGISFASHSRSVHVPEEDTLENTRQTRLSLLSTLDKNGRDMPLDECRKILFDVVQEYKKHREEIDG